jgi:ribose-phosphate pyrophosphokinase
MKELAFISGSSNLPLAEKVSKIIGVPLTRMLTTTFGNGERRVEILENVRNKDVFVIQSASDNTNDHLIELLLILDTLRRSSCYRVTVVMPCFPYSRQDRKIQSRVPISAKLIANLITTAGTDRFLSVDLHSQQISGFFDVPVDDLHLSRTMLDNIKKVHPNNNITIVSPDLGGVKRAKHFAGKLGCSVAIIYKQRSEPGKIAEMILIGEVKGKHCIIVDDMIDTGSTLIKSSNLLMSSGAISTECYCTHAVLSGSAVEKIDNSVINSLFVSDTINNTRVSNYDTIKVLSAAPLLAEAITGIHNEVSLAYLFDN